MAKLNLKAIVSAWIKSKTFEEVVEILKEHTGKVYAESTIKGWESKRIDPPTSIAQIVVDEGRLEWSHPDRPFDGAKIFMIMPIYDAVERPTHRSSHVLRYRYEKQLGYLDDSSSSIHLLRNRLADKFLATDGEWAFWLDSDMVPPTGYTSEAQKWGAKFDPKYWSYDVIERLMSHEKTLVSAVYFDKGGMGIPMFSEGRDNPAIAKEVQQGPKDQLRPTNWFGAGCCLVHRSVYEDMLEKMPEIQKSKKHTHNGFYTPLDSDHGEDTSFVIRAKTIGHQPYIDLGCFAGHLGKNIHFNQKIR